MWENPLDNMEIFEGNPVNKWKEIVFNASKTLAEEEIERLLEELAFYEVVFEEECIQANLRDFFYKARHDEVLKQKVQHKKNSIAIESMSKILSQNE